MSLISPLVENDVDLAPFNTLHVHARTRHFARVSSVEELQTLLENAEEEPVCILGGGSNVLFVGDFGGLIIQIAIKGKEIVRENEDHVWLKIGAGENWHQTVRYCVEKEWGGIENLSLIPGTVGAAPIQNIGAYGVELQDVFEELTAIERSSGKEQVFDREDCTFDYRESIFKNNLKGQFVVADVTLRLDKKPKLTTTYSALNHKLDEKGIADPTIDDISKIVIEIRNQKLPNPAELANAGSFFKNPIIQTDAFQKLKERFPSMPGYAVDEQRTKVPAGWLIEQAGWKGKEVGNVGTYSQQALVIVNHGGATGAEIVELSRKIQQSVKEKFDIALVPEVNFIG